MGFKFRKSIKILPGVRVNVSNKGVNSVSVGKRGAKVNIGKKGIRNTVGIPGSGLSYSSYTPYNNSKGQKTMSNHTQDYEEYDEYDDDEYEYERSVGFLLGLGIFVLPLIFAWFTLRQGHTTRARVISFAWLILVLFLSFPRYDEPAPTPNPVQAVPAQNTPTTPAQTPTTKQIDIAENAFEVYTKEAYPKMYAKYGDAGLKAFTAHDANAGFMVAGLAECDRVEYVGYSEQKSNYPTNLVSFVDCANNNRFYVSNGQVSEITTRIKNQSSSATIQTPATTNTNNGAVESESRQIPFNECVGLQKQSLLAVAGTGYKTSVIVDSSDLSVVRICTNDGSVLITCSRLDGKMVTTKSPHCP